MNVRVTASFAHAVPPRTVVGRVHHEGELSMLRLRLLSTGARMSQSGGDEHQCAEQQSRENQESIRVVSASIGPRFLSLFPAANRKNAAEQDLYELFASADRAA
jgi:hypothetical protein